MEQEHLSSRNTFDRNFTSLFYVPLDLCLIVNVIILQNRPLNVPVHFGMKPFELTIIQATPHTAQFSTVLLKRQKAYGSHLGIFYHLDFSGITSMLRLID